MKLTPHAERAGDDARTELDVDDLKGRLHREPSAELEARLEPAQGDASSHHVQCNPIGDDVGENDWKVRPVGQRLKGNGRRIELEGDVPGPLRGAARRLSAADDHVHRLAGGG